MDRSDILALIENLEVSGRVRKNALDVAGLERLATPIEATVNGYDGALSLHWPGIELAIFADHYELYGFSEGDTIIQHWPVRGEDGFDQQFVAWLPLTAS